MNFDRLTQKLRASAVQAAEAAANFHGFDEMAAHDEYIHSPDLNVVSGSRPRRPKLHFNNNDTNESPPIQQQQLQLQQQQQQQQNFDDESTLSTHSSLRASATAPHFTAPTAPPLSNPQLHSSSAAAFYNTAANSNVAKSTTGNNANKRHLVPLKVSVPERSSKPSIIQGSGGRDQPMADDSDSLSRSSDDEDLHDDPILSLLQQEKEADKRSQAHSFDSPSRSRKTPSGNKDNNDEETSNEGRTKHRFFQISMPEQYSNFEVESFIRQGPPSGDSSTLAVANPLNSLFSRAISLPWKPSGTQSSSANTFPAPFFARLREPEGSTVDPFSNVTVVSGAAILSADELLQLDRVMQQQKQSNSNFRFHVGAREAFIVFTLVLAAFVYFMSRNPSLI